MSSRPDRDDPSLPGFVRLRAKCARFETISDPERRSKLCLALGEADGIALGEECVITLQLERRFGLLDEVKRARLALATSAERARWSERLLHVSSLDEVFR